MRSLRNWGSAMLGKTHVAVGVAAALALVRPTTISECLCAVAGGALGAWICDIDVRDDGRSHDVWQGFVLAAGLTALAIAYDTYRGGDALAYVVSHLGVVTVAGIVLLLAFCVLGAHTRHRSFTHSVVGLVVASLSIGAICLPLAPGFAVGFLSHIALDMLNYQRVRVLYPFGRGFALGICRSSSASVNRALLVGSSIVATALFALLASTH